MLIATSLDENQLFGNIYGKIKNQKIVNANYAKKRVFQKFYTPRQSLTTWNTSMQLVENQPKQVMYVHPVIITYEVEILLKLFDIIV